MRTTNDILRTILIEYGREDGEGAHEISWTKWNQFSETVWGIRPLCQKIILLRFSNGPECYLLGQRLVSPQPGSSHDCRFLKLFYVTESVPKLSSEKYENHRFSKCKNILVLDSRWRQIYTWGSLRYLLILGNIIGTQPYITIHIIFLEFAIPSRLIWLINRNNNTNK